MEILELKNKILEIENSVYLFKKNLKMQMCQ